MKRTLPAIMLILVCLSNGYHVNTDYVIALDEESQKLCIRAIGDRWGDIQTYERLNVTKEDIQNIKDAMGVYEKEEGEVR